MQYLSQRREGAKLLFSDCKTIFTVALCLLAFASLVYPLEIPPRPHDFVNDYAFLLSPEAKQRLEARLDKFAKETSTQILVVTFPSLGSESLEDFTNRLFEAWGLGRKDQNNGVLLAIFVQERKVRIEVGYGLEGVLTDALGAQIIRNELAPHFRSGNPENGIENAVAAIEKAVRGEYKAEERKPERFPPFAAILIVVLLLFFISRLSRRGFTIGPSTRRGHYWDGGFYPGGGWTRGYSGYGDNSRNNDSGGGFSGGGFSGGGGLSGGGGASGSW